ncbi:TPA: KleE protein [Escherichia coli]|nr:KleE protein [Escherichia coli]
MNNIIKFPGNEKNEQRSTERSLHDIVHGIISGLYIVLVILWFPIRFLLIVNTAIQFFRMFLKLDQGVFSAVLPFVLSFLVLAVLTYIMATWKPKKL